VKPLGQVTSLNAAANRIIMRKNKDLVAGHIHPQHPEIMGQVACPGRDLPWFFNKAPPCGVVLPGLVWRRRGHRSAEPFDL
jgi:hypothetical protein